MALLYRGESRRMILRHPVFWIKLTEIVLALIIFPLCVTYNERGGIYVTNSTKSLNFTVKYPFDYNNNTIVYTDEDAPISSFTLDSAIQICAKLFVGVTVITCIAAVATLLVSCAVHKNERMASKVLIAEIFVAVGMAFLLVISTSLWLYNLLDLRKEVKSEIEYIITQLGPDTCKNCVEFLPNYAVLFASVGLAYVLFLVWLCNTVMVFRETINRSPEVTDTSSLVPWSQELGDKSPESYTVQQTTSTM